MVVLALQGADTILLGTSVVMGLAGSMGVAYTVFRSASEQRLRDLDKRIIDNQTALLAQTEAEVSRERQVRLAAEQSANAYRESLTQRAAVDHLSELVIHEEKMRGDEHRRQTEAIEMHTMLLKDIVAALKGQRGTIG